jgi:hypothetical protein
MREGGKFALVAGGIAFGIVAIYFVLKAKVSPIVPVSNSSVMGASNPSASYVTSPALQATTAPQPENNDITVTSLASASNTVPQVSTNGTTADSIGTSSFSDPLPTVSTSLSSAQIDANEQAAIPQEILNLQGAEQSGELSSAGQAMLASLEAQ